MAVGEFHNYESPMGHLVMQWLQGTWHTDQHTIELLMAADKQHSQRWFDELREAGTDFLILDRYTGSQRMYSAAQGVSAMWTEQLLKYVKEPDVEIYIDIPAPESMKRKGKHNDGENDRYESDLDLLKSVRAGYKRRAEITIDGMQPIEKVHTDIVRTLQSAMPLKTKG